jgi:hypothetical protein
LTAETRPTVGSFNLTGGKAADNFEPQRGGKNDECRKPNAMDVRKTVSPGIPFSVIAASKLANSDLVIRHQDFVIPSPFLRQSGGDSRHWRIPPPVALKTSRKYHVNLTIPFSNLRQAQRQGYSEFSDGSCRALFKSVHDDCVFSGA